MAGTTIPVCALPLLAACTAPTDPAPLPDPAAVRLAALTAAAAADAIDDLGAVDDPDAAGVRDPFRDATREALEAARTARDTAPEATAAAFARSLDAAEAAESLGDDLALALEARSDLSAAGAAPPDSDAYRSAQRELEDARVAYRRRFDELNAATDEWTAAFKKRMRNARLVGAKDLLNEAKNRETEASAKRDDKSAQWHEAGYRVTAAWARLREAEAAALRPFVERAAAAVENAEARREDAIAAYRDSVNAWRDLVEPGPD